jgi:methylmalonyl-CoA mutase
MKDQALELGSYFPPANAQAWEQQAERELKGKLSIDQLTWALEPNVAVQPYYSHEATAGASSPLWQQPGWHLRQDLPADLPAATLQQLLEEALQNDVSIIGLELGSQELEALALDWARLAPMFRKKQASLVLRTLRPPKEAVQQLQALIGQDQETAGTLAGHVEWCPLAGALWSGFWQERLWRDWLDGWLGLQDRLPGHTDLSLDLRLADAGATSAQEIAINLAAAMELLRHGRTMGFGMAEMASQLNFHLQSGRTYWLEVAKGRAARKLWDELAPQLLGGKTLTPHQYQTVHSAAYPLANEQPYNNLVRTTAQAMAAILGGADAVEVAPLRGGTANKAFDYRMARNIQLILAYEAHFNKVADPTAGAYYIEQLTSSIAHEAFALFQQIEEEHGGLEQAVRSGWLTQQVRSVAAQKRQQLKDGELSLVGVNRYRLQQANPTAPAPPRAACVTLPPSDNNDYPPLRPLIWQDEAAPSADASAE